ncbi:MAG: DinB family protein [Bacteroidetes bacterium]|nr:DinB family protein [Bacteroidota bacterium]
MASHLLQLCNYNVWANDRICSYIKEAGDSIADQEMTSSFPTVRKTLYHLWDAQEIWYKRLQGESPNTWPSHYFKGSLEESIDAIHQSSIDFVRFVEKLSENGHLSSVEFKSIDGTSFFNTIEEIVMHVMNHSTYHRGQLITMLRSAGFTAVGSTDMIRYYRELVKVK